MTYRVFLSSTSKDLVLHRAAVERAILGLDGFAPIAMEHFGARDTTASGIDETKVRECQVFVGLVGHCYGSSPGNGAPSYTEQEYELAKALGLPRLMFVAVEGFRLPANLVETATKRRRQQAYRARVLKERVVASFDEPAGLGGLVTAALHNWRTEREQVDRITAELLATKEKAARLEQERDAARNAVQALAERAQEPDAPPAVEHALALLSGGLTAEAQAIFADILLRKEAEGTAALHEAAEAARHLGALASLDDTVKAITAYATATRLDPDHTWSWIFLGRLSQQAGSWPPPRRLTGTLVTRPSAPARSMISSPPTSTLAICESPKAIFRARSRHMAQP